AAEHGVDEIVFGGVDIAPVELSSVGEGNGVKQKIERAPGRLYGRKNGIDGSRFGDVAMANDQAIDFLGQRFDALLKRVALVGERKIGPLIAAGASNAPSDRAIVGDAQDQPAFASH